MRPSYSIGRRRQNLPERLACIFSLLFSRATHSSAAVRSRASAPLALRVRDMLATRARIASG